MYGYKARKAAQVAAYFALKSGGSINVLKLAKLLYLVERESMVRFDEPMFYDRLVSMDHGPVTSISLNHINGLLESDDWSEFVTDRDKYEIAASDGILLDNLDTLARADIRLLGDLWTQFGQMNNYEIRDWTHENCPEWENPQGSSNPIPHERVFKYLEKANPEDRANEVQEFRDVSALLMEDCA